MAESLAVPGDQAVSKLDSPDEGATTGQPREQGMPSNTIKHDEARPAGPNHSSARCDDLDRAL